MVLELLQYHGGAGVSKLHLIYHPEVPDAVRKAGQVKPCASSAGCANSVVSCSAQPLLRNSNAQVLHCRTSGGFGGVKGNGKGYQA